MPDIGWPVGYIYMCWVKQFPARCVCVCQLAFSFGLFGILVSLSTTRLYRGRAPRQSVWQFYVLPHTRQSWETMTSVSDGHIILTPTQPVRSGRPQRKLNPRPPHHELHALQIELPCPPFVLEGSFINTCSVLKDEQHHCAGDAFKFNEHVYILTALLVIDN